MWCERISFKTGLCKYSAGNPGSVHGADGVRNSDHIQTAGTFRAKECFLIMRLMRLQKKERAVMKLVADGKSNKEIAGGNVFKRGNNPKLYQWDFG